MPLSGESNVAASSPLMMVKWVKHQFQWHVCTVMTRRVWRYVLRIASTVPKTTLFYTIKTCVLVVATVYLHAHLELLNLFNMARLLNVAKWTFCAGGPETEPGSQEEREKYGANRIAEGKLPMCASLCSTKALMAGPADKIAQIMAKRVHDRGGKDDRSNVTGVTYDESLAYDASQSNSHK